MTATTMALVEFLRARLDEDERRANNWWRLRKEFVGREVRRDSTMPHGIVWVDGEEMPHGDVYERSPQRRELAEVEAKRRILDVHPHRDEDELGCETCDWKPWWPGTFREPCPTVRLLALPYAGHPDYRDEWRP